MTTGGPVQKIAVISDLHAFSHSMSGIAPSLICATDLPGGPFESPLLSIEVLIKDAALQADLLLCPGDLCHRADSDGLRVAWNGVLNLGRLLKAKAVIATTGNHDIDPGLPRSSDIWAELKDLTSYPLADARLARDYWDRNFAILDLERADCRILTINTCAHHGQSTIESACGRVDGPTLRDIASNLEATEPRAVNILICHHNPDEELQTALGRTDSVKNGSALLELLRNTAFGSWLVIHGHNHRFRLDYAGEDRNAPVVLGSGSFAARSLVPSETEDVNQFHLVHMDLPTARGASAHGYVKSWNFNRGQGWREPEVALPCRPAIASFGSNRKPR